MVAVSVIIPTYRREAPLRRCLADVLAQRHSAFEVLIVDQSPDHETETWATLRALPAHAHHIRLEQPSVTAAVNVGARQSTGRLLLFLDDDIEIDDRDLLVRHARHFEEPSIAGVVGRIVNAERRADLPRPAVGGSLGFLAMNFDHPYAMDVPTAAGANMSFRREVVERLGFFDERYTANAFRWETDFSLRVIRAGYRIRYDPDARVVHHYGTPGGCDNGNLLGRTQTSHGWYEPFFRNNAYFALKLLDGRDRARFAWRLYREHVMNRAFAAAGPGFLARRHAALARGVAAGWRTWRQARAEAR
ncbi:MAG TPA: glycosyltransferase [Methylomirabilota bacterium]|jgi:GT2 family glycosyltransferase|nr:glycosyltransferase [Methylomirabilota bacterium]